MGSESKKAWWRQLGAISQGMLFLDGHIATAQAAAEIRPQQESSAIADGSGGRRRSAQPAQDGYAKRVREMTALSLFR